MSDTLTNALAQSAHSQSVLAGIQNPAVVNPLAGMGSAITAVSGMQGLAAKQGEQLVGQALQQATDENGNLDFPKAQKIAAGMGPSAAYAMQGFLKTSSELRGQQINNVAGSMKLRGLAAMSALNDASDGNINTIFDNLISNGMSAAEANQERARILAMGETARKQEAWRYGVQSLEQMHQTIGQTTLQDVGGQLVPQTTTQPSPFSGPGGVSQGPGALNVTPSPGQYMGGTAINYPATQADVAAGRATSVGQNITITPAEVYRRAGIPVPPGLLPPAGGGSSGVVDNSGKPVSPSNPPRLLNVPGQPAAPAAPGAPAANPGAPGGPTIGAAIQAPQAAPAASQLPVPPIPPAAPPPGPRSSLEGGVPVASANPLQAPTVGAPGPPSPLVPSDVNAIMAGMNQRRAAGPSSGTQAAFNTIATGPGTEEAQGYKTSADKLAADDLAATEWQSTKLPYVEALKNYGEGTKTGPTTDFWNQVAGTIRTPLAKLGINVGPLSDTTERVDALGKWLASIQSTNPVSAKSDAELAQVLKGSASTHINEVAGEDMVKAGFTLRRMGAALNNDWHNNPALQTQYGTYLRYLGDMNNKIDPRAFSIDMLNDAQKARLRSSLQSGSEADAARFEASLALARRSRQVP